jgi:hypothetical protein
LKYRSEGSNRKKESITIKSNDYSSEFETKSKESYPMQKSVDENNINPGEQLREFLKEVFPADVKYDSFISRIDYILQADGELIDLVYNSTINYVLRRLIVTADYFQRKCKKEDKGDEKFITNLRAFLKDDMHFPEKHIGRIIVLIRECLNKRNAQVAESTKHKIRKRARNNNKACYICGGELEFDRGDSYNSVQVEHKWPKAMGGSSDNFNLEVACQKCNGKKSDYIDASDFHYEKICLVSSDEKDEHFSTEMNREYELALWAKREFKCSICEKSAADAGKLKFGRKNPNDSWHFLNIEIFCEKHHKIRG